jgi:hypothetical protein
MKTVWMAGVTTSALLFAAGCKKNPVEPTGPGTARKTVRLDARAAALFSEGKDMVETSFILQAEFPESGMDSITVSLSRAGYPLDDLVRAPKDVFNTSARECEDDLRRSVSRLPKDQGALAILPLYRETLRVQETDLSHFLGNLTSIEQQVQTLKAAHTISTRAY